MENGNYEGGLKRPPKLNKAELKKALEEKGLNPFGTKEQLEERALQANLPIFDSSARKKILGYEGEPKGALEIACERGFVGSDGKLKNGKIPTLNGTTSTDTITKENCKYTL